MLVAFASHQPQTTSHPPLLHNSFHNFIHFYTHCYCIWPLLPLYCTQLERSEGKPTRMSRINMNRAGSSWPARRDAQERRGGIPSPASCKSDGCISACCNSLFHNEPVAGHLVCRVGLPEMACRFEYPQTAWMKPAGRWDKAFDNLERGTRDCSPRAYAGGLLGRWLQCAELSPVVQD